MNAPVGMRKQKGLRFGPEPFWMPGFEILERPDVLGLQTLGALRHLKFYALRFLQAAEPARLDGRAMHEKILATLAADDSITLRMVNPLYCSLFYILCSNSFRWR